MQVMEPIYQMYVDAIKGQAEAQEAQQNVKLNALKTGIEMYQLQTQLEEQQIARQIWSGDQQGQKQSPGAFDPAAAGGASPDANPSTGEDPALQTADRMEKTGRALMQVNPMKGQEWLTKASTIRDQYYTRQKAQIEIRTQQADQVGKIFGSVQTQEDYTNALAELQQQGIDIRQFQLTGNLAVDGPQLKRIAEGTLKYKDKLDAQHQATTEQQALLNYQEKVRHDQADEGLQGAKISVAQQAVSLRAAWDKEDLDFKSRADARAQAGLARTDAMDLAKTKDFALRPGKQDKAYVDSVIATDPTLANLPPQAKAAASAEIQLRARAALAKKVTKPGDTPNSDDFMSEVAKATQSVAKRVKPGTSGFFGIGGSKPSLGPFPAPINSKEDFNKLGIGDQFSKGSHIYKKTGATTYEEID